MRPIQCWPDILVPASLSIIHRKLSPSQPMAICPLLACDYFKTQISNLFIHLLKTHLLREDTIISQKHVIEIKKETFIFDVYIFIFVKLIQKRG